jgi:hypothetical protein
MIRIEKIVRLFLSSSQLFFPGIYILYFKGGEYEDLAVDFYVFAKSMFATIINSPESLAKNQSFRSYNLMAYVMLEAAL